MKKWGILQYAIFLLCLTALPKLAFNQCLISSGMQFKKHRSKMLDVKPFEVVQVSYYLECLHQCEAKPICRSVNIKQKKDQQICELLALKGNNATLAENVNSTHYEDVTIFKAEAARKNYCEPECSYFGECTISVPKCRCSGKGSIQPLQDHTTVKVGAKGNKYGSVTVNVPSGLYKIKLVYHSGFLSCVLDTNFSTTFGCRLQTRDRIEMKITSKDNTILLPGSKGYTHDGKISRSTFVTFNNAIQLTQGQKLRIWYGEDLLLSPANQADNAGSTLMYVLAIAQQ